MNQVCTRLEGYARWCYKNKWDLFLSLWESCTFPCSKTQNMSILIQNLSMYTLQILYDVTEVVACSMFIQSNKIWIHALIRIWFKCNMLKQVQEQHTPARLSAFRGGIGYEQPFVAWTVITRRSCKTQKVTAPCFKISLKYLNRSLGC